MEKEIRLDKWLWAVRIFKTRSQASEACRKGRVIISDVDAKPSRIVKLNDIISVRKPPVNWKYKVLGLIDNRVSAKIAMENYEDLTAEEEKAKLVKKSSDFFVLYEKGKGRPTKKDRRLMDKFKEDL